MDSQRRFCLAVTAFAAILWNAPCSLGQDRTSDVTFHQVAARSAIEQLAQELGKSVVFDLRFSERDIDFDAQGVTKGEALYQLLEANKLYSVEVGEVLIVAPDTMDSRRNYSARRIDACRIQSDGNTMTDVIFHNTPVQQIFTLLTKSIGKEAVLELSSDTARRPYTFEIRDTTIPRSIGVLCLVLHLSVQADGEKLVFSEPSGVH